MTTTAPEPQGGDQGTPQGQQPGEQAPPWGSDFDAEKAWKLVQGLRADKEKLAARPFLDDAAQAKLAEYDKVVEAQKSAEQKAQEEATRWQTEAERWKGTAVAAKVQALAAADFADPDDAVRSLDSAKYLGSDGQVDEAAIAADLAALLEAKPHYRRAAGAAAPAPRPPAPNRSQGAGGKPALDPAQEFAAILSGGLTR